MVQCLYKWLACILNNLYNICNNMTNSPKWLEGYHKHFPTKHSFMPNKVSAEVFPTFTIDC